MRLAFPALAAILISSGASAAPVMLNCVIDTQNDGPLNIDLQLNEQAGTVSYSFPQRGNSFTTRAIFTPNHVAFGSFAISRTELTIQRKNDGEFDQPVFHLPPVENGKCGLDTRKRAF
jgi:hypothetical protein